jgi:hypothetical protein
MKKTPYEIKAFKAAIASICERYRIGLMGTCDSEGIYGEITLFDLDHPEDSWREAKEHHLNWSRWDTCASMQITKCYSTGGGHEDSR